VPLPASPSLPVVLDLLEGFALLKGQNRKNCGPGPHVLDHHIGAQNRLAVGKLTGSGLIEHRRIIGFSPRFALCAQLLGQGLKLGLGSVEDSFDLFDLLVSDAEIVGHPEHMKEAVKFPGAAHIISLWATPSAVPWMIARRATLGAGHAGETNQCCEQDQ